MSDTRESSAQPAASVPKINNGSGFTKREYAAILLRVPDSGEKWLDDMILKANTRWEE